MGLLKVAKDLGISESMLYLWRKNSEQTGIPFEGQKIQSAELARLKRENAQLQQEKAFLKKMPRTSPKTTSEVRMIKANSQVIFE